VTETTNSATSPAGKIVTFYSYKGGTGRSMALANVAWILAANRKRVLVLDWDLEAPGLHRYFRPFLIDKYLTSSDGLIDFVMDFADRVIAPAGPGEEPPVDWYVPFANITRYALSVNFREFPSPGKIDLIPAGRQGPAYATRVSSFNWQNLYDRLGGGAFLEAVKVHMRRNYDYVLIDSRTGVSDTAGICTVQMPDALAVCFTYNNQSMEGAAAVAHSSVQGRRKFLDGSGNKAFNVFPVPTRVEQAEQQKLGIRQRYARRLFNDLLAPNIDRGAYWGNVEVPYVPFHGYEETLAAFTDDPNDTKKILHAMINIAGHLTETKVTDFEFPPVSPDLKLEILRDFAATPDTADEEPPAPAATKETTVEELVRVAEAHFLHLAPEQQEEARRVWTRLVHVARPDEGVGHSRQRVKMREFGATATPLVRALAQTMLLSVNRDDASGEETVAIDNEALIGSWTRLRAWLAKDLDFLFWRQRLRDPIQDWEASGYKNDFLLRGAPLRTAQQWVSDHGAELNEAEKEFIERAVQMSLTASIQYVDSGARAAIIRPFGTKQQINFDDVERSLIIPALERLGISGRTVDILEVGSIRADMLERLLTAKLVVADLSVQNANVFYELGIRHALLDKRTFLLRSDQDQFAFDLRTDRFFQYRKDDPGSGVGALVDALRAAMTAERADSPVFRTLPRLRVQDRSRFVAIPPDFREEVERAVKEKQPGDLELLADETRGFAWMSEGLRLIGRGQIDIKAYEGARASWEAVRTDDPADLEAALRLGTVYQRLGDLPRSDQALLRAIDNPGIEGLDRAEAYALLGRNAKARWRNEWETAAPPGRRAAALASPLLRDAFKKYERAFAEDLNHFYSGLNALAMLSIMMELAEAMPDIWSEAFESDEEAQRDRSALQAIAGQLSVAVQFSITTRRNKLNRDNTRDMWLEISAADLALLTSDRPSRLAHLYRQALAGAPDFAIDVCREQLMLYEELGVRLENTRAALSALSAISAEPGYSRAPSAGAAGAGRLLVFTGHAIDSPGRPTPRFPSDKEPVARQRIMEAVQAEMALPNGVAGGIAGGASGGDILFHEVCEALGIKTRLFLPVPSYQFVNGVAVAGPSWVERFTRLSQVLPTRVLGDSTQLPRWLQEKPGYSVWQRSGYWMLSNAIAEGGAANVTVMALWNGEASADGVGGTKDLLQKASEREVKTIVIPSLLLDARNSK
jgi:hypothetical protein